MAKKQLRLKPRVQMLRTKEKKVPKELVFSVVAILFGLIAMAGTTYAVFQNVFSGTKEHSVVAGTFSISFTEGSKIDLQNAYPMTDQEGQETSPYTFSIRNTGNVSAVYRVRLEEDTSNAKNQVPREFLKLSYKKGNNAYSTPVFLSDLSSDSVLVTDQTLGSGASINYEVKLWLAENATNEAMGKSYKAKIVVEAVQATESEFADTLPPVIELNGDRDMTLFQGATFSDPGVKSVVDDHDGTLSVSNVTKSYEYYNGSTTTTVSSVNTSNLGIYYIYYRISDQARNQAVIVRSVNVVKKDTTRPTIALIGMNPMAVSQGSTFSDPGVSSSDDVDGLLSPKKVVTVGTPRMGVPGNYVIKYLVIDQSGNTATTTRTVQVIADTTAPVITLSGDSPAYFFVGETYTDPGYSASDNIDGNITSKVVVSNKPTMSTAGTYTVRYTVSDAAGNAAVAKTRTVYVKQKYQSFSYTGSSQSYSVVRTGRYRLQVWGAQGGYRSSSTYGGKGGYATGEVRLTKGQTIYVYVGGSGKTGGTAGGFNGGGPRDTHPGGGGATDIRIGGTTNYYRVIVAGGGGSDGATNKKGMHGGGSTGGSATENYGTGGGGGTQSAGGTGSSSATGTGTSGTYGAFGQGGKGYNASSGYAGAGGGGWYGGAGSYPDGSGDDDRGGGGGSGFVWISGATVPSGYAVSSTYYLSNASTTAGNISFAAWTSTGSSGTETGHSGNGNALITYIGS